jgi:hypothetical protein
MAAAVVIGRRAEARAGAAWGRGREALRSRIGPLRALGASAAAGIARGAARLGARVELALGAVNRAVAALAGAAGRSLAAGLGRCRRVWLGLPRPGLAALAARAEAGRVALWRALKSGANLAGRGLAAALRRWWRR